jgi:hypothetical protein
VAADLRALAERVLARTSVPRSTPIEVEQWNICPKPLIDNKNHRSIDVEPNRSNGTPGTPPPLAAKSGYLFWKIPPGPDTGAGDARMLVDRVRRAGVWLVADNRTLHVTARPHVLTPDDLAELGAHAIAILKQLHAESDARMVAALCISAVRASTSSA